MGVKEIGRKIIVLCIFFILIALTVMYSIFWFEHVKAYNEMIENTTKNLPPEVVDNLDFKPVILWKNGERLSIALVSLAIFWLVFILSFFIKVEKKINWKTKLKMLTGSTLILILINGFLIFSVSESEAIPYTSSLSEYWSGIEDNYYCAQNAVDLLFAGDEEFLECIEHYLGFDRYAWETVQERHFPQLRYLFFRDAEISIAFHGWEAWDSDDYETEMIFQLIEAMEELNWHSGEVYRETNITIIDSNGKAFTRTVTRRMDILVVLTVSPQPTDMYGFAMTEEASVRLGSMLGKNISYNAVMVAHEYPDVLVEIWCTMNRLQHELTHIFGMVGHCDNAKCVMNPPEVCQWQKQTWCSECKEFMLEAGRQEPPLFPPM